MLYSHGEPRTMGMVDEIFCQYKLRSCSDIRQIVCIPSRVHKNVENIVHIIIIIFFVYAKAW